MRDYIHVVDLAEGQVAALDYLDRQGGLPTVNVGTGQGYSVLDMVKAFERASGRAIACKIAGRPSRKCVYRVAQSDCTAMSLRTCTWRDSSTARPSRIRCSSSGFSSGKR